MLITSQDELNKFCEHLLKEKVIAVDTEFVREKSYYPVLSVIQIGTSKQICAIDVLANLDLSDILKVLVDRSVLKIFHAAKQDIEVLYNHFKKVPLNIFDTQIAAQFAGAADTPSYDKLVQKYCGVAISKQHQFSDWLKRPLSASQIEYALGDVTYLIAIKNLLTDEVALKEMLEWLDEENKALENYTYKAPQPIDYLGKFLNSFKSTQSLSRVYVLLEAREKQAEATNKPRNFILRDEAITQTVKSRKLGDYLIGKLNISEQEFLKQAENPAVHQIVKKYLKASAKRTEVDVEIYEKLRALLAKKATILGLPPSLIANRTDLNLLTNGKAESTKVMTGWRKTAFGQDAAQFLAELGIKYCNGQLPC